MDNFGKFLFNTHINAPSILFGLFTLCMFLLFIKKLSRKEVIILIIPTVYYSFDIIASCITKYAQSDENIWFYNWVLLLELLLYFFVFKSLFQSRKIKRIISFNEIETEPIKISAKNNTSTNMLNKTNHTL